LHKHCGKIEVTKKEKLHGWYLNRSPMNLQCKPATHSAIVAQHSYNVKHN